jgi:hypothetical protein
MTAIAYCRRVYRATLRGTPATRQLGVKCCPPHPALATSTPCAQYPNSGHHSDGSEHLRFVPLPDSCSAAKKGVTRYLYSITSSARASSIGGSVRPSAFAVLRLITSSNLPKASFVARPITQPSRWPGSRVIVNCPGEIVPH